MKSLVEKEKEFESFILSQNFGKSTYLVLTRFEFNFRYVIRTMELYHVVLARIDQGDFKTNANEIQLRRTKQFVILDILSRLMAATESLFILLYALQSNYSQLPIIVTRYPFSQIDGLIKKIKERNLPMQKILGFPNLKTLNLDKGKRRLFHERYEKTYESVYKSLNELADFYEQYKIMYGKSRHGFSFFPDMSIDSKNTEDKSDIRYIFAFDRRQKNQIPPNTFTSEFKAENLDWFNTVSILKISPLLLDKIKRLMKILEDLVKSIINNHLSYAENCGEDYVPSIKIKQGEELEYPYFYGEKLSESEEISIFEISKKLVQNMHIIKRKAVLKFTYNAEKVPSISEIDSIINIWSEKPESD